MEARLSFVAHVGRSRVIGAHMALGLIRGCKKPSNYRGGGGRGERSALWHSYRRESGEKQGSSTVFPLPFPFPFCGFLCFSIVQPSISPQQLGAPFLPLKTYSVLENLKLFQRVSGQQTPPRRNPKHTRWETSGNVAIVANIVVKIIMRK